MDVSIDCRDEYVYEEGDVEAAMKVAKKGLIAPKEAYHWLLLTTHDGESREIRAPVTPKKQAS